jgi:hypothetical protein
MNTVPIASIPGLLVGYLAIGCLIALAVCHKVDDGEPTLTEFGLIAIFWPLLLAVALWVVAIGALMFVGYLTIRLLVIVGRAGRRAA